MERVIMGKSSPPRNSKTRNPMLLDHKILLVLASFVAAFASSSPMAAIAQPAQSDYQLPQSNYGKPIAPAPADPAIAAALAQVSAARIRATVEALVAFGTRSTLSSMETDLPPGQGVTAAADWIAGQFEAISRDCNGCLEVKRDTFTQPIADRIPKPTTITNIYAILRGAPSESNPALARRMYLVTGHYDSRNSDTFDDHTPAPGANDDATGVAVSIECARVLSKLHLPATLVFVAVAGEEQGLNGSAHLAQLAKTEGWQLEGVLNNDIVGGNSTPGDTLQRKDRVRVFSEGIPVNATPQALRRIRGLGMAEDSPSRQLARAIADVASTYRIGSQPNPKTASNPAQKPAANTRFEPFLVARPDRYLRGGDHSSFNDQGFAAVRLTEWREDFNHQHQNVRMENGVQYGDLLRFVDFAYVANVTRLNAATLATLAASPGIPRDLSLVTRNLENSSTLEWSPPEGITDHAPAGVHYELLWRETTAPNWQFAQAIPASSHIGSTVKLSVTVPISKDNVVFGLRAVDDAGHRGLVVTP